MSAPSISAADASDGSNLPMPTAEEILEDLRSAPDTDVAFTFPPVEASNRKTSRPAKGDKTAEVERVAAGSIRFVNACENLTDHSPSLAKIMDDVEQYIDELRTAIPSLTER